MYYSAEKVKRVLENFPKYQSKLYCRGFLVTKESIDITDYPFYHNWKIHHFENSSYCAYTHYQTGFYVYFNGISSYFLIGHAFDPYHMEEDEYKLLKRLAEADKTSRQLFWQLESDLSGVFTIGVINKDVITISTDCTGMSMTYYGIVRNGIIVSSHSKLVADLFGFEQDPYIKHLISSKFYKYWGTWLPGDLSPYLELKHAIPNFSITYRDGMIYLKRYFPIDKIKEVETDREYGLKLDEIDEVLINSMKLIARKWPNQRAAISVTGGRDSTTTLACARDCYDQFKYFSYISVNKEKVDAEAAERICQSIGVNHTTYIVPENDDDIKDIEIHRMILECNAGCIGRNNSNDVRKRAFFENIDDFDIEIKSWVSELSRAEAQNKYNKLKWPRNPSPGYYRSMWKVIVSPYLIKKSNEIFKEFLEKYYDEKVLSCLPWTDLFYWEFSWPGGEGQFLTAEHKYAYDITIPYNNRRLLKTMFEVPLKKRLDSSIQKDTVHKLEPRIENAGCFVKNLEHTKIWTVMIKTYLSVFSKINL